MSLAFSCRLPAAVAAALDELEPEERDSVLEAFARKVLEDVVDRAYIGPTGDGGRGPVGLMHHYGAPKRFGSSPGGGPLTGRNTAAFARV